MPSVTSKLLSDNVITESDLWRIGPSLVAVDPSKFAAVQAYIETLRFGPMLEWLSRGYYATDVGINETDYSVILYRKTRVESKPTQSALVLNHSRLTKAIGQSTLSGPDPLYVTAQIVVGSSRYATINAASAISYSIPPDSKVWNRSTPVTAVPMSKVFANKINVGHKSAYTVETAIPENGRMISGRVDTKGWPVTETQAVVIKSTENATTVRVSAKDWPLIEGPSVMTYGEVVTSPQIDFTVIFCNHADVAEAIRAGGVRYTKDVSTLEILKRCDQRPNDGFCYFRNGNQTLNPLSLIPEMAEQADSILAGNLTIDGVDYSAIRNKWGFGASVVGGYTSGTVDTTVNSDLMNTVTAALGDSLFASFTVDSSNVYKLSGHDTVPEMGESEFNAVAILLIAQRLTVSVNADPSSPGASAAYANDANARIANYAQAGRYATVTYAGCNANVGHMLCGALMTDQTNSSVKLARGFVVPSYLTTV